MLGRDGLGIKGVTLPIYIVSDVIVSYREAHFDLEHKALAGVDEQGARRS